MGSQQWCNAAWRSKLRPKHSCMVSLHTVRVWCRRSLQVATFFTHITWPGAPAMAAAVGAAVLGSTRQSQPNVVDVPSTTAMLSTRHQGSQGCECLTSFASFNLSGDFVATIRGGTYNYGPYCTLCKPHTLPTPASLVLALLSSPVPSLVSHRWPWLR